MGVNHLGQLEVLLNLQTVGGDSQGECECKLSVLICGDLRVDGAEYRECFAHRHVVPAYGILVTL